ncbi:MAG: hypothetical protein OIF58_15330, partial [Cohaesibacter sp.]|nr:hypothetical protein [Cohaesibacter sp.]
TDCTMIVCLIAQSLHHGMAVTIRPHLQRMMLIVGRGTKASLRKYVITSIVAAVLIIKAFRTNSQVAILNKELANDLFYMRSLPQNGICPSESHHKNQFITMLCIQHQIICIPHRSRSTLHATLGSLFQAQRQKEQT